MQRIDLGEQDVGEQRETCRIADERTERTGVKPAHDPVMPAAEDDGLIGKRSLGRGDVVHAEPVGESRDDDERHEDEAGVLEPERGFASRGCDHCRVAAELAEDACGDDQRNDELHDADADKDVIAAQPFMANWKPIFQNAVPRPSAATKVKYNEVSSKFWTAVHKTLAGSGTAAENLELLEVELTELKGSGW